MVGRSARWLMGRIRHLPVDAAVRFEMDPDAVQRFLWTPEVEMLARLFDQAEIHSRRGVDVALAMGGVPKHKRPRWPAFKPTPRPGHEKARPKPSSPDQIARFAAKHTRR